MVIEGPLTEEDGRGPRERERESIDGSGSEKDEEEGGRGLNFEIGSMWKRRGGSCFFVCVCESSLERDIGSCLCVDCVVCSPCNPSKSQP